MEWLSTISMALGSAWTSGINLYATVTVLGLLQKFGFAKLPGGLDALDNWWIIGFGGFLFLVEFFADKIPYIDSVWDAVHTFIRVPAGVVVAYAATADLDSSITIPAALIGGGVALSSHGTKAALRGMANLSPEPVSNWTLSFVEDGLAIGGSVVAAVAPLIIGVFLIFFLGAFAWFVPKIVRMLMKVMRAVKKFVTGAGFSAT